jgi:hypothetical protein
MVRRITLLAVLACSLPAYAADIGIFVQFENEPSPVSVREMKKEVAKLVKPAGFKLDWRFAAENPGNESFDQLLVLRFKGACQSENIPMIQPEDEPGAVAFGTTEVADGRILPYSEVRCDEVRKSVTRFGWTQRQFAMGRALGRVVAHELYHVMSASAAHAASGLAKPVVSWDELTAGRFGFRPVDLRDLQEKAAQSHNTAVR